MKSHACVRQKDIKVAYDGECSKLDGLVFNSVRVAHNLNYLTGAWI